MSRGDTRMPPADFASRAVPSQSIPAREMWRCAAVTRPLVDWDERSSSRFSFAGQKILYLGDTKYTAFWEVFGDDLLDRLPDERSIPRARLDERQWVRFRVPQLSVLDLTKPRVQRKAYADFTSASGNYAVTQQWSKAIAGHPERFAGIKFLSRLGGDEIPSWNLAVFGREPLVAAGQSLFSAEKLRLLTEDVVFLNWLAAENISII